MLIHEWSEFTNQLAHLPRFQLLYRALAPFLPNLGVFVVELARQVLRYVDGDSSGPTGLPMIWVIAAARPSAGVGVCHDASDRLRGQTCTSE